MYLSQTKQVFLRKFSNYFLSQMKTITQRLSEFFENQDIKVSPLEIELGFSNGMLSKAIKRNSSLKSETLEKIFSKFPDLSKNWLILGEGEMFLTEEEKENDKKYADITAKVKTAFSESTSKDIQKEYWKAQGKIEMLEDQLTEYKRNEQRLKEKISELLDENNRLFNEIKKLKGESGGDQNLKTIS